MSLCCFWKLSQSKKRTTMSPSAVLSNIDPENAPPVILKGIQDDKSALVVVDDIDGAKTPLEVTNGVDIAASQSVTPNGINGANGHAEFSYPESETQGPYQVVRQYHSKPSKLRVAGIGAGASGMY